MQKVEGSNPFSRSRKSRFAGLFRCSSRVERLRHRTMTGQSCPRRLASAVGRCFLAGDSERPTLQLLRRSRGSRSTAPGRCSYPTGTPPPCPWSRCCLRRGPALSTCAPARRPTRERAPASAATPASAQERHSCRDRRECSSHGKGGVCSRLGWALGLSPRQQRPTPRS